MTLFAEFCKIMCRQNIIRWKGVWLVLLMLTSFGARDMHFLFAHQASAKICAAAGREKHIHGEDYTPHACNICDFSFSIFELPKLFIAAYRLGWKILEHTFHYEQVLITLHQHLYFLRGPPFGHITPIFVSYEFF